MLNTPHLPYPTPFPTAWLLHTHKRRISSLRFVKCFIDAGQAKWSGKNPRRKRPQFGTPGEKQPQGAKRAVKVLFHCRFFVFMSVPGRKFPGVSRCRAHFQTPKTQFSPTFWDYTPLENRILLIFCPVLSSCLQTHPTLHS